MSTTIDTGSVRHPRTLVAFYSMSGNTRVLARELRDALNADLEEIRERSRRRGWRGMVRCLVDSVLRRTPYILPAIPDPAHYDLVVIGGPVWAGRLAAPVRSFAQRYGQAAPCVAFFSTQEKASNPAAFDDLARLCQRIPVVTLAVDARHLGLSAHAAELKRFTARLRQVGRSTRSEVGQTVTGPLGPVPGVH